MPTRLDIQDLRYFIAVCESQGFARASQPLHTVQSNVSARMKKLEQFLGVPLFHRHYRGVVMTEQGERLYAYAKRVVELVGEIESELKNAKVPRESLNS